MYVKLKKKYGQNFLIDENIVNKIVNDHNGELDFFPTSNGAKIEINFKSHGN